MALTPDEPDLQPAPEPERQAQRSGRLRVSDADRDVVAEVLHSAYAEGRITLAEHEERTEAVHLARTFDDLVTLTDDLVPVQPLPLRRPEPTQQRVVREGASDEPDRMSTVMASVKRTGPWRIRAYSVANNVMGSIHLDLTEATFDAPVVEINGTHLMGSLFVRVPLGTTIRDETTKVLGETSIKDIGDPDPSMPTVVIRGTNLMSGIKVRGPKKPPGWRKALT